MRSFRRGGWAVPAIAILSLTLLAQSDLAFAQVPPPAPDPSAAAAPPPAPIPIPMPAPAPSSGPSPMPTAPINGGMLKGMTLADIDHTMGTIEGISDIVGSWIGPKPPARPEFMFADSKTFDMQLHQSMAGKLGLINVQVNGAFTANATPERMGNWLNQVKRTGGTVSECVMKPDGRGWAFLLDLVLKVLQAVDRWQLYQPAKNYNALLLINEQGQQVRSVIFLDRNGPQRSCPDGSTPLPTP